MYGLDITFTVPWDPDDGGTGDVLLDRFLIKQPGTACDPSTALVGIAVGSATCVIMDRNQGGLFDSSPQLRCRCGRRVGAALGVALKELSRGCVLAAIRIDEDEPETIRALEFLGFSSYAGVVHVLDLDTTEMETAPTKLSGA